MGHKMKYQFISFDELQKRLERIEDLEERIEKLSFEIFLCKNWICHLKKKLKNLVIQNIQLNALDPDIEKEVLEIIDNDLTIKENCSKYLLPLLIKKANEPFKEFLSQAKQLLQYYLTLENIKDRKIDKKNGTGKISTNNKIVWKADKVTLLKICDALCKNEFLPKYKTNEILVHFCDEKHICYINAKGNITPLTWIDSDGTFAIFVNELAKRGAIIDHNKFKMFKQHFINQNGEPFKNLSQNRNYTDTTTNTGELIRNILKEISFSFMFLILNPFIALYALLC